MSWRWCEYLQIKRVFDLTAAEGQLQEVMKENG